MVFAKTTMIVMTMPLLLLLLLLLSLQMIKAVHESKMMADTSMNL